MAHLEFAENNLKKESAGAIRSGKGELWWGGWKLSSGRVGWFDGSMGGLGG